MAQAAYYALASDWTGGRQGGKEERTRSTKGALADGAELQAEK